MENVSPALTYQSAYYPLRFNGRVPKAIKLLKTVKSDILFQSATFFAEAEKTYPAWTNSHGAVAACLPDGTMLGVKPDEFEIIEWF